MAGVLATLAHYIIDPVSQVPLVGASGAISGVMGAYLLLYPGNRIRTLIIYFLITVIDLRAVWLLLIWFALQTIQGLLSIGVSDQVSTAFFAHIGGFVVGAAVGLGGPDAPARSFRRDGLLALEDTDRGGSRAILARPPHRLGSDNKTPRCVWVSETIPRAKNRRMPC